MEIADFELGKFDLDNNEFDQVTIRILNIKPEEFKMITDAVNKLTGQQVIAGDADEVVKKFEKSAVEEKKEKADKLKKSGKKKQYGRITDEVMAIVKENPDMIAKELRDLIEKRTGTSLSSQSVYNTRAKLVRHDKYKE